jgi:purine-binding chemotaxis protein CheW
MPAAGDGQQKVLVIERGDQRFGLIADAVCDIVTVEDAKRFATPSLMRKPGEHGMQAESSEVLELGEGHTICLLDPASLLRKLA